MNDHKQLPAVLISGASIAGPALAYFLSRQGFKVTVVERAPSLRPGGYKIDVRGTAVQVLQKMGVMEQVREHSVGMLSASFVDANSRVYATLDAEVFGMREPGDEEIMRGDLALILYERTKASQEGDAISIEYVFGESIKLLKEDQNGITVEFENGYPSTRFDLVVGCDGLHSRVRNLAFGAEETMVDHLGTSVAVFTVPNSFNLDRTECIYSTLGRTSIVYSTKGSSDARAFLLFTTPADVPARPSRQQQIEILHQTFGDVGWVLPKVLESITTESTPEDLYFDQISQVRHLPSWSAGRVVLLGDAGYGPSLASGQGTSQALVGAYILAGELKRQYLLPTRTSTPNYQAAFEAYQTKMTPFVEANMKLGRDNVQQMVPRTRLGLFFGTLAMRLMPYLPGTKFIVEKIKKEVKRISNMVILEEY
ncbi:FAD-dependent oxidoreductase [Meredithblackwellia eburnea MCA 4105]